MPVSITTLLQIFSGSERDLRQQRRSLFQAACRRQGISQAQPMGLMLGVILD